MVGNSKPHLCKVCGETNPDNFYGHKKSECKKCTIKRTNLGKGEYMTTYRPNYESNRYYNDPPYRFIKILRIRQKDVLKGRSSTTEGLGCTNEELVAHLVSQFTEGMTLENHGYGKDKWNMEHTIPLSSHERDENGDWDVNSEYNKKLIHFTNIKPMWHTPNMEKSSKINEKDLKEFLERKL